MLADVLKRAKAWTPEDLRAALAETNMMTAFGPVKFVSWGKFTNQNKMDTLVLQVSKKKFETVWPPEGRVGQVRLSRPALARSEVGRHADACHPRSPDRSSSSGRCSSPGSCSGGSTP